MGDCLLEAMIPMELPSGANLREHWATKAKRVKMQREAGFLLVSSEPELLDICSGLKAGSKYCVTFHRVGKRLLDDDNLAYAFKAVRDGVAQALLVNDNHPGVQWAYEQSTGKHCSIVVKVEAL